MTAPETLKPYQSLLEYRLIYFQRNSYFELAEWTQAAIYATDRFETEGWPDESGMGALIWGLGFPDLSLEDALETLQAIYHLRPLANDESRINPELEPLQELRVGLIHVASLSKELGDWSTYGVASCALIGLDTLENQQIPRPYTLGPLFHATGERPRDIADAVFSLFANALRRLHEEERLKDEGLQSTQSSDRTRDAAERADKRVRQKRPMGFLAR